MLLSRWTRVRFSASTSTALVSAALVCLTASGAWADWGDIGGGWKRIGADKDKAGQIEQPEDATARRASFSPAPLAAVGVNHALVRNVAQKYANHRTLRKAGISGQEFIVFFEAMIQVESGFKEHAHSSAGAIGLAQLMPDTARYLGVDPYDRHQNVEGGVRYLIELIDEFGTLSLAVAAYNAGPQAVTKYGGVPPYRETERHVAKVLSIYERQWRRITQGETE